MKKLEVSEEFIKEAHKAACSELKGKIEKEFHELFEVKLGVGSWYKNLTHEGSFMFYDGTILDCGHYGSYGVDYLGKWHNEGGWGINDNYVLATKEEIETILWKEAETRGFKKGVIFKSPLGGSEYEFTGFGNFYNDSFYDKSGLGLLFYEGKWAEVITTNKEIKEEIEKLQKQLDELKQKTK